LVDTDLSSSPPLGLVGFSRPDLISSSSNLSGGNPPLRLALPAETCASIFLIYQTMGRIVMIIMREFLLAWALGSSTLLLLWRPTVLRRREFPRRMMVLLHKIFPPHIGCGLIRIQVHFRYIRCCDCLYVGDQFVGGYLSIFGSTVIHGASVSTRDSRLAIVCPC
jgi:hypothetical protein